MKPALITSIAALVLQCVSKIRLSSAPRCGCRSCRSPGDRHFIVEED